MLEVKNISKKLGGQLLMDNFSLTINQGEIVAIVGESGSGKTTLIRILNQLEVPDNGQIRLNNQTLFSDNLKKDDSNNSIGLVFQDFQLFPNLTVIENCTLSPVLNKELSKQEANVKADGILDTLGLSHKLSAYPKNLSGGQKQRVAIARALMLEPQILCLDEPTSALDYDTANQFGSMLMNLMNENIGIIMITHDLNFAQTYSNRIVSANTFLERTF